MYISEHIVATSPKFNSSRSRMIRQRARQIYRMTFHTPIDLIQKNVYAREIVYVFVYYVYECSDVGVTVFVSVSTDNNSIHLYNSPTGCISNHFSVEYFQIWKFISEIGKWTFNNSELYVILDVFYINICYIYLFGITQLYISLFSYQILYRSIIHIILLNYVVMYT